MSGLCKTASLGLTGAFLACCLVFMAGCDDVQSGLSALLNGGAGAESSAGGAADASTTQDYGAVAVGPNDQMTRTASTVTVDAAPASGAAPLSVRFGASAHLQAGRHARSYSWNFGDGSSGTGQTITHLYQQPGVYSAIITVIDDRGARTSTTTTVRAFSPRMEVQPASVDFGEGDTSQTLTLSNVGDCALTWTTTVRYIIGPAGWLGVAPASGIFKTGQYGTVSLTADRALLPAGGTSAEVTVTAGNITKTVVVSVAVVAVAASAELIHFDSGTTNTTLNIWNAGSGTLRYMANSTSSWLGLTGDTSGASTGPADRRTIRLTVDRSSLAPGDYNSQVLIIPAAGQIGSSKTIDVTMTIPAGASTGKTSTTTWQNTPFSAQGGAFTAEFDAIPNAAGIDGLIGLSAGAGSGYSDFAVSVRFNDQSVVDARSGGTYTAVNPIRYEAGKNYHFRVVVNVPAHTYSVYVIPQGSTEQTVATNYPFRTEQAGVASLANWGIISTVGSETVGNFTVTLQQQAPLTASAGGDKTIIAGQSATLSGSACGGQSPYTYCWSPATGLNNTAIANPTASPTATTTYTLTVTDGAGQTAAAGAVVTVNAPATGIVYFVDKANGSDTNPGTASSPWKTLSKAGISAKAGSTVIVKPGTYTEMFRPTTSGTGPDNKITVISDWAYNHRALPRDTFITGAVDLSSSDYLHLEGFDVSCTTSGPNGILIQSYYNTNHGKGVEVVNNYIHDTDGQAAILAGNTTDLLIDSNEMYNNAHTGVSITGTTGKSTNVTIRRNYIHHNGQDGAHLEGVNILLENNRIGDQYQTDQHQDGIEVYGPMDGLIIRNNMIWDTTQNIYLAGENNYIRNVQILGNIVWSQNYTGGSVTGFNIGPGVSDMTNLRIEGNTFANCSCLITDSYAQQPSYCITGLSISNNIFYNSPLNVVGIVNDFPSDYNLFYYTGSVNASWNGVWYNGSLAALRAAYPTKQQHSIQANPLFDTSTDPSNPCGLNYHLSTNSPAIDKGMTVANLTVDYDGTARPLGSAFDIGAYEKR